MHRITAISALLCVILSLSLVSCSRDPKDWKLVSKSRSDEQLSFHVALNQRNTHLLEGMLMATSDPDSPRYGEMLTKKEILDLIAPSKEDHDAVVSWFESQGLVQVQSFGDALKVTASVHTIENMLQTTLYTFVHRQRPSLKAIRQVGGFKIPEPVSDKIYMITSLTSFPFVPKQAKTIDANKSAALNYGGIAINTIRQAYGVPAGTAAKTSKSNVCLMEFLPTGAPRNEDVQYFCKVSQETYTNYTKIIGPFNQGDEDTESTLDVELAIGLATKVAPWYYTVTSGWIYEMGVELFDLNEVPQVVSISYSWPEKDTCDSAITGADCQSYSVAQYLNRTNIELLKLALRRVTVVGATGDAGAPGPTNQECTDTTHPVYSMFPSASPYITSVSATTIAPASSSDPNARVIQGTNNLPICSSNGGAPFPCASGPIVEWACMFNNTYSLWTTGGGFSEYASMPSYQTASVAQYLSSNAMLPPAKFFNARNRGYPDISAVGARTLIINGRTVFVVEGTSAATPIIAAMISLLNDARLAMGKTPLGYLTPVLYKMQSDAPTAFYDITVGENNCSEDACCPYGYGATKGWDAVTGLGTPNFTVMRNYVTKLQ